MPTVEIPGHGAVYFEPPTTEDDVLRRYHAEALARIQADGFRDFDDLRQHVRDVFGQLSRKRRKH